MVLQLQAGLFSVFCNKTERKKIERRRCRSALAILSFSKMEIETHEIEQGHHHGEAICCLLGYIEDLIHYLVPCKFNSTVWIKPVDLQMRWKGRDFPHQETERELSLSKEKRYSACLPLKTACVQLPSLGIRVKSLPWCWGCNPCLTSTKGNILFDCNRWWVRSLASGRQNYFISVIPFRYGYFSNSVQLRGKDAMEAGAYWQLFDLNYIML